MTVNYYQTVTDNVLNTHNNLVTVADQWSTDAIARMDGLAAETASALTTLEGIVFSPTFTDNLTYMGPGGTRPEYATEPDYSNEGPSDITLETTVPSISAFSFSGSSYTGLVKTNMTSVINSILGGSTILPAAVYDAMYTRLLADLAEQISVSASLLSHIINTSLNKNFYDFINFYRVQESQQMLLENVQGHRTILEILYEAGFNSKSVFNQAFKKHTGMTPTEFVRKEKTIAN